MSDYAFNAESLVEGIARRSSSPDTQIDLGKFLVPVMSAPLSEMALETSEKQLGFALPRLLTLLYSSVGNGGFGPGYGLLGLDGGAVDDLGHNAVEIYTMNSERDPEDSKWLWPEGLLPICHWGCAIYSFVNCKSKETSIVTFDPNLHDDSWSKCYTR